MNYNVCIYIYIYIATHNTYIYIYIYIYRSLALSLSLSLSLSIYLSLSLYIYIYTYTHTCIHKVGSRLVGPGFGPRILLIPSAGMPAFMRGLACAASTAATAVAITTATSAVGFPSGIILQTWNDAENISMAPAQG